MPDHMACGLTYCVALATPETIWVRVGLEIVYAASNCDEFTT